MSEYKPKYEIGAEFYALEWSSISNMLKVEKKAVERITQLDKDKYQFTSGVYDYTESSMYDTLKEAKEQANKKVDEHHEKNKKLIEEYEG